MDDKLKPCDRMMIPVYLTFAGEKWLRVDREMFDESAVICLRWYDENDRMHQRIAVRPAKWYDGKNYYKPEERLWCYE